MSYYDEDRAELCDKLAIDIQGDECEAEGIRCGECGWPTPYLTYIKGKNLCWVCRKTPKKGAENATGNH